MQSDVNANDLEFVVTTNYRFSLLSTVSKLIKYSENHHFFSIIDTICWVEVGFFITTPPPPRAHASLIALSARPKHKKNSFLAFTVA